MVDLRGQYEKIKPEIDTAIQEVINNTAFINGPEVKLFAKELAEYLGIEHVIPCANGTDALQIALMALDLQPGDEIITTGFTFIATVEVIALLGLRPVLVDVDPKTFNMVPDEVEKAITSKSKAIIPVHLFGQCANMEALQIIAKKHNLAIIEDAAQALGTNYIFPGNETRKAGTMGEIGCTSFFPSKNLGCFGDGGALFTANEKLANTLLAIRNHGMIVKYHNDRIGVNSRFDTMQAAITRVKLKYLDDYNKARQNAAKFYDEHLSAIPGISIPMKTSFSTHIYHQYTVLVDAKISRDDLKSYLASKGIPSMIYYPIPLHKQKAFTYLGYDNVTLPVTEKLCEKVLSLPMHTELEEEQLGYICQSVNEFVNSR